MLCWYFWREQELAPISLFTRRMWPENALALYHKFQHRKATEVLENPRNNEINIRFYHELLEALNIWFFFSKSNDDLHRTWKQTQCVMIPNYRK